ncbi:DUF4097 family beta strand repeat-containing protein [Kitasatospora sp. NBC_01302]|uniref:DUF4097 family beta strand repeat-containing protein n=1 Tax=Kitasatospora sp. NBC_01302 TaxID=2903575 RepID=UPI002E127583|nr:DUF4097 domain-containing protein [Kitasatospora sp. NBC_01302]
MSTVRTLLATRAAHLDLRLPVGNARVCVDPAARAITVMLSTPDDQGPAADAIHRARCWEDQALNIQVPEVEGGVTVVGSGGRSVYQSFGTVTGNVTGVTIVNGRVIVGGGGPLVGQITATVTLPPTAAMVFRSVSGDLNATDHLPALGFTSTSGDLRAQSVEMLVASTVSGDVQAERVGQHLTVETTSGDVRIGVHEGSDAAITTVSGDVRLTAGRRSSGELSVRTVSGDIELHGTAHLAVRSSTVSGRNRRR